MISTQIGTRTIMRRNLVSKLEDKIPNTLESDGINKIRQIDDDIRGFLKLCDPTLREKVVLLINHIIIMDKLAENGQISWQNDERHSNMHDLLDLLHDFGASSSSLPLKESVYYYTACLCFKVHDYRNALHWFKESKNVYQPGTVGNELLEIERIRRNIFIAFCYEYIGQPELAIVYLLGISSIDIFETAVFEHTYEITSAVVNPLSRSDKYSLIKLILNFFNFDDKNIFYGLIERTEFDKSIVAEVDELIHVFSHCLSEYHIKTDFFEGDPFGKIKLGNLIRLIATKLIDTLDDQYVTCKATIRAEGDDRDGALEILPSNDDVSSPRERAEINFYRFYFFELFSEMYASAEDDIISDAGRAFKSYCQALIDKDSKRDALLHYHVFEVKRWLRTEFERILRKGKKRNNSFSSLNLNEIGESFYAVTQESRDFQDGFSSFANDEIKRELRLLHICLNILLEIKSTGLPLFFSNDETEWEFTFDVNGNQLFELCKMFSSLFLRDSKPPLITTNEEVSNYRTYFINNLRFDIITEPESYAILEETITLLFENTSVNVNNVEPASQSSTTKILFGAKENVNIQCEYFLNQIITSPNNTNIRVFFVGEKNDEFGSYPIVAFPDLKTCILMAFIYATIEIVLDYICKPKPILILAPLRDTGSYFFQAVNLDRFLSLHSEPSENKKLNSEGIGVMPHYNSTREKKELKCTFKNETIQKACHGGIIYRDTKLFVLKNNRFIEKTNVNHQLIRSCYEEYSKAREKARRCRAVPGHDKNYPKCRIKDINYCSYVFRKSDSLANQNTIKNPSAKRLLLELIIIACKEDIVDYENLYVLENSLAEGVKQNLEFEIIFFSEDMSMQGCYHNWLTIDEIVDSNRNDGPELTEPTLEEQINSFNAKVENDCELWKNDLELYRNKWLEIKKSYHESTSESENAAQKLVEIEKLRFTIVELQKIISCKADKSKQELDKIMDQYKDEKEKIQRSVASLQR